MRREPRPKNYLFVCVGCDSISASDRRDTMSCSTACRVRAHRNGSLKTLHALAESFHVAPETIQHAAAVRRLRPDLSAQVLAGRISAYAAQIEAWPDYWALVEQQA